MQSALGAAGKAINECRIPPEALDEFVNLIDSGKISGKQGKGVFAEMFTTGKTASAIVKETGIEQLSDVSAIEKLCDEVIAANPKPVADFRSRERGIAEFSEGTGDQIVQRQSQSADCWRNFGAETEVAHASGLHSGFASETLALP